MIRLDLFSSWLQNKECQRKHVSLSSQNFSDKYRHPLMQ